MPGPLAELCETIADLFRQYGLKTEVQGLDNCDGYLSVLAFRPSYPDFYRASCWIGIRIDGDEVLCDAYARDVNYRDRWIDDDGHLFIETYGLSQFDPEAVIPKLVALLPGPVLLSRLETEPGVFTDARSVERTARERLELPRLQAEAQAFFDTLSAVPALRRAKDSPESTHEELNED